MLPPLLTPLFFFLIDPAPPEFYTLPLHAALPIWALMIPAMVAASRHGLGRRPGLITLPPAVLRTALRAADAARCTTDSQAGRGAGETSRARLRSEEHTSELQSPCNLVCRLLLEKK